MKSKNRIPFKNQLALARARRAIEQKQVAVLLGHRGIDQLSRYERGVKLPSLKAALKLGLIYKIPIRILLDGYLDACREEMKRQEKKLHNPAASKVVNRAGEIEFCTIEENLKTEHVKGTDLAKARRHATQLISRHPKLWIKHK